MGKRKFPRSILLIPACKMRFTGAQHPQFLDAGLREFVELVGGNWTGFN